MDELKKRKMEAIIRAINVLALDEDFEAFGYNIETNIEEGTVKITVH